MLLLLKEEIMKTKRGSINRLNCIISDTQEKTKKRKIELLEKRSINKRNKLPDYGRVYWEDEAEITCGQNKNNRINWFCIQGWFISKILEVNPDWLVVSEKTAESWDNKTQTWWGWKEKNCSERLLKLCGVENTKKIVEWYCENWQTIKDNSNGRVTGSPSVCLLWVCRDRFISDAVAGLKLVKIEKKHTVGEYDADTARKPTVGWGEYDF